MAEYNYKIRYGIINSHDIANIAGPEWALIHSRPYKYEGVMDWSDKSIKARDEIAKEYMELQNKLKKGFYEKLEESILEHGFIDPLNIISGYVRPASVYKEYIPIEMREDPSTMLFCASGGASRLHFAQKYNMDVPAIISDFNDRYNDFELLETEKDIRAKYKNEPNRIMFYEHGIFHRGKPNHSFLNT